MANFAASPNHSVLEIVLYVLRLARRATRVGRLCDEAGPGPVVLPPDISDREVFQHLLIENNALSVVVTRLAGEIDALKARQA